MRAYELMVLIDPEVDERTVEPTLKKYLEVVTNAGGTVDNIDVWGRRKTAYILVPCPEGLRASDQSTTPPPEPR
ncbi:30S ribosomal protein S6 [Streptococcus pneumoniae]|nr:30S ribosomal protein S6 [Streptococcus pneumoniae]